VIREGKLIAEGTVAELQQRGQGIVVRAEPQAQAREVLTRLPFVGDVRAMDGAVRVTVAPEHAAEINTALVGAGLAVSELRPAGRSLEEAFFELTGGGENGERPDEAVTDEGTPPAGEPGAEADAGTSADDTSAAGKDPTTDTEVRAA
jgi:ABC-2 type transport system ATP-binding protein